MQYHAADQVSGRKKIPSFSQGITILKIQGLGLWSFGLHGFRVGGILASGDGFMAGTSGKGLMFQQVGASAVCGFSIDGRV